MSDGDEAWRVLVVDDDPEIHKKAREQLHELVESGRVSLHLARNEDEAEAEFTQHLFDLVLLDLNMEERLGAGREVLGRMFKLGVSADVILMTGLNLSTPELESLLRLATRSRRPHVVDFIAKENIAKGWIRRLVSAHRQGTDTRHCEIEGIDFLVGLIDKPERRKRYPEPGTPHALRSNDEVRIEIVRLMRNLFGRQRPVDDDEEEEESVLQISLGPLTRLGLSAAVVVRAEHRLHFPGMRGQESPGECVVKVGPVLELEEEYSRYLDYVRFGVPLRERVELLGFAKIDSLAAIAYSVAGGSGYAALASLDEILRDHQKVSASVLGRVFQNKSWYGVDCGSQPLSSYFLRDGRQMLRVSGTINRSKLRSIAEKHQVVQLSWDESDEDGRLAVGDGPRLRLPPLAWLAGGYEVPWALVHGDMHGGNVLVELTADSDSGVPGAGTPVVGRIGLIDFRNSGPGPRCIDAAALECSVRLAHAERMCRLRDPAGESAFTKEVQLEMLHWAAKQYDQELSLMRALWGHGGESRVAGNEWSSESATIVTGIRDTFSKNPVSREEYLRTLATHCARQLGYDHRPVSRVRLCALLAAVYAELRSS